MQERFCKIAPGPYSACPWDLSVDAEAREYWVRLFRTHFGSILHHAGADARQERKARGVLEERLGAFEKGPGRFGRVTIITLDEWRTEALVAAGFADSFAKMKEEENARMLGVLPVVCRELDEMDRKRGAEAVIRGIFAGNIFDMGAQAAIDRLNGQGLDFLAVRRSLPERPWLIDDFDALENYLKTARIGITVLFVDNAGSDFILGALPLARWLVQNAGSRVVLAANSAPALNDMTVEDIRRWWPRIVQAEPSFGTLPLEFVGTGTGNPLIDLSGISPELNAAARDADFVVIEGMGRGVESNLEARFSCPALNIAMIKDEFVARRCGGKNFDLVCRFR